MSDNNQRTAKIIFLTGRVDGLEKLMRLLQERLESDRDKIDELKAEIES